MNTPATAQKTEDGGQKTEPSAPIVKTHAGVIVAPGDVAAYQAYAAARLERSTAESTLETLCAQIRDARRRVAAARKRERPLRKTWIATPSGQQHERAFSRYMHEKYPEHFKTPESLLEITAA